jgi:hypothetical protein
MFSAEWEGKTMKRGAKNQRQICHRHQEPTFVKTLIFDSL